MGKKGYILRMDSVIDSFERAQLCINVAEKTDDIKTF